MLQGWNMRWAAYPGVTFSGDGQSLCPQLAFSAQESRDMGFHAGFMWVRIPRAAAARKQVLVFIQSVKLWFGFSETAAGMDMMWTLSFRAPARHILRDQTYQIHNSSELTFFFLLISNFSPFLKSKKPSHHPVFPHMLSPSLYHSAHSCLWL